MRAWQASSPSIEGDLSVSVYDFEAGEANEWRRTATPEETQRAILFWIQDIHDRIGAPKDSPKPRVRNPL